MPENIRAISDEFVADGNTPNSFGLSNMVWSFGAFLGVSQALLHAFKRAVQLKFALHRHCRHP